MYGLPHKIISSELKQFEEKGQLGCTIGLGFCLVVNQKIPHIGQVW